MRKKPIYVCPYCEMASDCYDEVKIHSWYCGGVVEEDINADLLFC